MTEECVTTWPVLIGRTRPRVMLVRAGNNFTAGKRMQFFYFPRSTARHYPAESFSGRYNYYDSNKHCTDYLYPVSNDVLGSWKHYNLSAETMNFRNQRARSPIITRELDRYLGSKQNTDFRHFNYRPVPYFGGSDDYK